MSIYETIRAAVETGLASARLTEELTYREPLFDEDYDPRTESGGVPDTRKTYTFDGVIQPVTGEVGGVNRGLRVSTRLEVTPSDLELIVNSKDLGFSFKTKGEVLIDSKWWMVLSISPPYSGDQVVTYAVQLRRR